MTNNLELAKNNFLESIQQVEDNFAIYLRAFMLENPGVKSISWDQYTDYFNDGEPCYFRVHDLDVTLENEDDARCLWEIKGIPGLEVSYSALQELENLIQDNANLMLSLYDDHATVTVTRDQVEVVSYDDHD